MWKPGLRFQISEIGERWKDVSKDQIVWLMNEAVSHLRMARSPRLADRLVAKCNRAPENPNPN